MRINSAVLLMLGMIITLGAPTGWAQDDLLDAVLTDETVETGTAEAEPAAAAAPDEEAVKLTAEQYRIKIQALEEQGKREYENALEAMAGGRYQIAVNHYEQARATLPVRPATDELRAKTILGLADAYMGLAQANLRLNDFTASRSALAKVKELNPAHPQLDKVTRELDKLVERSKAAAAAAVEKAPEVAAEAKRGEVRDLVAEGRRMFDLGEYDNAEILFDQALVRNPYDKDAMRFLQRLEDRRFKLSTIRRQATSADMMRQVRDRWSPPFEVEVLDPANLPTGVPGDTGTTQDLQDRLNRIIIPEIEFRQANIVDVITFLREAALVNDPEGVGVNIILNLNEISGGMSSTPSPEPPAVSDPWADFGGSGTMTPEPSGPTGGSIGGGASGVNREIGLNLRKVTLYDAIKFVTEIANLKYRLDGNVVIITPANQPTGPIMTRLYPVQPALMDVVIKKETDGGSRGGGDFTTMGTGETTITRGDVREFFTNAGVPFPAGTSITYNPGLSKMIVANTAENLEIFERILRQIDVLPKQVEIEARFVEVAQNDLEELGFEWLLNDPYEMAVKKGSGPISTRERIVMAENASIGGLTRGVRYMTSNDSGIGPSSRSAATDLPGIGGILGISSILTNPEMSLIIHALDQKGGVDLLSAPRVTTRSGVNAQIQVVREIIYPTEFEADVQTIQGGDDTDTQVVVVTPGSFETRETGVILNVTPTVGPDGYTIDLAMVPEVAELVEWIQYGSTLEDGSTYNIPQPIFSSRNVTTSIIIWDGQTVVMGGLIREELAKIDDKVPLLGDIPIIGRLFRNKGEYSRKQNLLIFVTARLVDPSGKVVRRGAAGDEIVVNTP